MWTLTQASLAQADPTVLRHSLSNNQMWKVATYIALGTHLYPFSSEQPLLYLVCDIRVELAND